jgi:hypothetical protein
LRTSRFRPGAGSCAWTAVIAGSAIASLGEIPRSVDEGEAQGGELGTQIVLKLNEDQHLV